jgi:hypothetical protein
LPGFALVDLGPGGDQEGIVEGQGRQQQDRLTRGGETQLEAALERMGPVGPQLHGIPAVGVEDQDLGVRARRHDPLETQGQAPSVEGDRQPSGGACHAPNESCGAERTLPPPVGPAAPVGSTGATQASLAAAIGKPSASGLTANVGQRKVTNKRSEFDS